MGKLIRLHSGTVEYKVILAGHRIPSSKKLPDTKHKAENSKTNSVSETVMEKKCSKSYL